jgi:exocyst complex component 3
MLPVNTAESRATSNVDLSQLPPALPPRDPVSLADALEESQQRITDLLQHPDDLSTKLPQLKHKFTAEKASVDAILKTSVKGQLDDTAEGLMLLHQAHRVMQAIRENLGTIDTKCLDDKSVIANYAKIKLVR